jgi:hypothetical protein
MICFDTLDLLNLLYPQARAAWVPAQLTCVVTDSRSHILTLMAMVATDIALLLVMLTGLLRLRCQGGGTFGIAQLLWKQV